MLISFYQTLGFAFGVTAPIFLLVSLGVLLRRLKMIDEHFVNTASRIVFTTGLPTLLFVTIIKTDLSHVLNWKLVGTGLTLTMVVFFALWLVAPLLIKSRRNQGIFIQGSFRGNMGIVGLAFSINAYGEQGLAAASLFVALVTVLYNILSVFILTRTLAPEGSRFGQALIKSLISNPIIIGILCGLLAAFLKINIHPILLSAGESVAAMTLPLALICIGGSLSLAGLRRSSYVAFVTVLMKLIVVPALMMLMALPLGFSQFELGIYFLMVASPAATASYIMVQAMKGDGALAANIVVLSTFGSVISVSVGLVLLKSLGVI